MRKSLIVLSTLLVTGIATAETTGFLPSALAAAKKTAVVAQYDIPSGTKFSAKYLTTVKRQYVPVDYVNSIPLITGQYCRFNIKRGELLSQHHVSHALPRMYPPMPELQSILAYRQKQLDAANQEQPVTVVYLSKSIPAGKAISSSDLVKRNMKVGEVPRDAVGSIKQARGKRARGALMMGQVLSYRDLTTVEAINKKGK